MKFANLPEDDQQLIEAYLKVVQQKKHAEQSALLKRYKLTKHKRDTELTVQDLVDAINEATRDITLNHEEKEIKARLQSIHSQALPSAPAPVVPSPAPEPDIIAAPEPDIIAAPEPDIIAAPASIVPPASASVDSVAREPVDQSALKKAIDEDLLSEISNKINQKSSWNFGGLIGYSRWKTDDGRTRIPHGVRKILDIIANQNISSEAKIEQIKQIVHDKRGWRGASILNLGLFSRSSDVKNFYQQIADQIEKVKNPSIKIEAVEASRGHVPEKPNNRVELRCSEAILSQFRHLLSGSRLLGTHYLNPYTGVREQFPTDVNKLTARHLQLLARIESVNVTGKVNFELYAGLLTNDTVAAIRCLVKGSTVAGLVKPTHFGGYFSKRLAIAQPQPMIVVDQSGLQWQSDFRNTGGMFFYPKDPNNTDLNVAGYTQSYTEWQNAMFSTLYGINRPAACSENHLDINWYGVPGKLDLDQVSMAIASEFRGAWDAVVSQGDALLDKEARINFKFLRAGMGFFAHGLGLDTNQENLIRFELARLSGILQALTALQKGPLIGKIKRLELPFSDVNDQGIRTALNNIEDQCKRLGLEWGGTPTEDALAPRDGFVNATTNCGDPHAMIGNEGSHQSVDASIATNTPDIQQLNPTFNVQVRCVTTPTYIVNPVFANEPRTSAAFSPK